MDAWIACLKDLRHLTKSTSDDLMPAQILADRALQHLQRVDVLPPGNPTSTSTLSKLVCDLKVGVAAEYCTSALLALLEYQPQVH